MNPLLSRIGRHPEMLILLLVLVIIAMLVIPLPTPLVDLLIGTNMVIALLVFLGSFYIERILDFSSFPSVLLITTLFRLALSISTSRLILLEGDAGMIISTFGQFVIGDSLVVGFVIFSIVTVVQFIVITKGSERVAEVAARFSLDAMPGKQMSIDADLKAGVIDADGAKARRLVLEKESQLYGSFDGAMKFIKGDAIAGILIIVVNFVGGVSVGVGQHGLSLAQALSTYTIQTIGDGLVAQIPALLISISAGFIVTRVNGEGKNLGQSIMAQLFGSAFVLQVTAVLALGLALLPGFPSVAFVALAAALAAAGWRLSRRATAAAAAAPAAAVEGNPAGAAHGSGDPDRLLTATVPLLLVFNPGQREQVAALAPAQTIRQRFFAEYGVRLPAVAVEFAERVAVDQVAVLFNEVRVAVLPLPLGCVRLVSGDEAELAGLGLRLRHVADRDGRPAVWVEQADPAGLDGLGVRVRAASDELYLQLAALLTRSIAEFFGVQETKNLLDQMERVCPDLVKETYRHASVQRIAEVLQRLVQERLSIRNMKLVLEGLAQWAPREKDVIALVECVRGTLARYISHRFALDDTLNVVVLSPELEETIRQGVRQTASGVFLNLDPAESERVIDRLTAGFEPVRLAYRDLVLIASVDIRRFVKRLIEPRFDGLEVLSYAEISDSVTVNVITTL